MFSSLVIISFALMASVLSKENNEPLTESVKTDAKTFYDQRQTGKYNVHVNIKDVQFFSLSDSLGNIGGDYDYGDYGSYDLPETDSDYDSSHLTVNPIFAFLGSKPTAKPTTTSTSTTIKTSTSEKSPSTETVFNATEADEQNTTLEVVTVKQELETTVKQQSESVAITTTTVATKPALKPLKVNDSIEYEEIPVEVQYYRANHPKLPLASLLQQQQQHHGNKRFRRPSVQILDGRNNNHNVKIIENDHFQQPATIKICGHGEFRDNYGRCRLKSKAHGRNRVPGLRRVFNVLSSLLPKSK
ncbi:hypothetical protein PVAND_005712 [Polypedilum vanderplanki]|uniref:Uncharacterized protein n=1 Tax=Polypedilum vanderplanki TaxID=319348 RepID=A0A9J6C1E8_POLVA|nr:hypothetical protein PVAND_005712 [Polypedilum vanderplanki]